MLTLSALEDAHIIDIVLRPFQYGPCRQRTSRHTYLKLNTTGRYAFVG